MISRKSIIIAVLCVICSSSVFASTDIQAIRIGGIKISFGHLDLTKPAGQQVLYRRLQNAARNVCGPTKSLLSASAISSENNRQCYQKALGLIVEAVDNSEIKALHATS